MRKVLVSAFVIVGGFVGGCAGAPAPASATHVVVGEASFNSVILSPGDDGDHQDDDGTSPHWKGPGKGPGTGCTAGPFCVPQ